MKIYYRYKLPYIKITHEGIKYSCLLDSGCNEIFVDNSIKVILTDATKKVTMFNKDHDFNVCKSLFVGDLVLRNPLQFKNLKQKTGFDLVVGSPFFVRNKIIIDFCKNILIFETS